MAKISELKEMIVDLKVQVRYSSIPSSHCPYAYYDIEGYDEIDCNAISCSSCKIDYFQKYREQVRKEVRKL